MPSWPSLSSDVIPTQTSPVVASVGGSCSASTLENKPCPDPLYDLLGRRASISDP
jgi:hypothetical protein